MVCFDQYQFPNKRKEIKNKIPQKSRCVKLNNNFLRMLMVGFNGIQQISVTANGENHKLKRYNMINIIPSKIFPLIPLSQRAKANKRLKKYTRINKIVLINFEVDISYFLWEFVFYALIIDLALCTVYSVNSPIISPSS